MCWTCCIENLKAQIAKEDINVYKVVLKATKKSCMSPFMKYVYYSDSVQPSLDLHLETKSYSSYAIIREGYYSYRSVNFVCDSIGQNITDKLAKVIHLGKESEVIGIDNSFYLATFTIPIGAKYFINEDGVIVSNNIRYTGKYIKL